MTEHIEYVQITPANADERIREAIETIIHCWGEWEAEAMQEVQKNQNDDAYFAEMHAQLDAVLRGMIFDRENNTGATP